MSEHSLYQHPRYVAALWYAWGQQDAGVGHHVDANAFALHHATEAVEYEAVRDWRTPSGRTFLSSIAGSWQDYINTQTERQQP